MNNKEKRISITSVLVIILLVCVVILAVVLVTKWLKSGILSLGNDTLSLSVSDNAKEPNSVDMPTITPSGEDSPPVETTPPDAPSVPAVNEEIPTLSDNAPKPVYTQEELLELYPDTVLCSTSDAGDEYIDDIYFVGDSTTHGMAYYGVLSGGKDTTKVWTPRSGTLAIWDVLTAKIVLPEDDSEMTIPEAVELKKPKMLVFTLGVNGVSSQSEESFTSFYEDLLDEVKRVSPDTVIVLQSIYPVCSDYKYINSISMEKINLANTWIAKLADKMGCYYLNTASVLVDETGYLNPTYSNGDGIHLSPEGFAVILEYIRTHAVSV